MHQCVDVLLFRLCTSKCLGVGMPLRCLIDLYPAAALSFFFLCGRLLRVCMFRSQWAFKQAKGRLAGDANQIIWALARVSYYGWYLPICLPCTVTITIPLNMDGERNYAHVRSQFHHNSPPRGDANADTRGNHTKEGAMIHPIGICRQ